MVGDVWRGLKANLPNPMSLPKNDHFTKLVIVQMHEKLRTREQTKLWHECDTMIVSSHIV